MLVSFKKIMLLGLMVSCLGLLLYAMPETQVKDPDMMIHAQADRSPF